MMRQVCLYVYVFPLIRWKQPCVSDEQALSARTLGMMGISSEHYQQYRSWLYKMPSIVRRSIAW
jgi:hypothetical protein